VTAPLLAIFDVDGTLVDSRAEIVACFGHAFEVVGAPRPTPDEILPMIGISLEVILERMLADHSAADRDRAATAYRDRLAALRAEGGGEASVPFFPGAEQAIARLAARPGMRLGLATGKRRSGLDFLLDTRGLDRFFSTIQTADAHPSKPDPSMVLACLAETGVPPQRAVIVGDTEFDIAMGRAAGIATIAVTWGYHPPMRLRAAGADRLIDDFGQLDAALDALLGSTG
jgi:phosphoglycolate phosphatase